MVMSVLVLAWDAVADESVLKWRNGSSLRERVLSLRERVLSLRERVLSLRERVLSLR